MLDKDPRNEQGFSHGLWDVMWSYNVRIRGNCIDGNPFGYWILYKYPDGLILNKQYYAC